MVESQPPRPRLFSLVLAIGTLLLIGQALWFYLMGHYGRILLPAMLALVLVVAALLATAGEAPSRASAYLVLICGFLLIAVELPGQSSRPSLWIGLPPILTLVLLPLGPALLLNLALTPVWLALLANGELDLDLALGYLALVTVASLALWERLRQRALLHATDPWEQECRAMTRDSLRERLAGEFERSRLLQRPLAVLLLHLPQLDMAREQFGAPARQAMLDAFCRGVVSHCRELDTLGRESEADFWLVLPDTTESGALLVRQRLRQALDQAVLVETGPLDVRMRLETPRPGEAWPAFLQRLEAMTQAQAMG
ncbi:GGDEF domain-containing protein [Halomonas beimenensis]|uniref:Diguanylate cyclase n=1 Tax=Halomonas beimenensis TaxID=475662 RepID=A0A291P8K5_9GAMM|nr:diguanylate cyclase [Halomonas beimenensis]ATJ83197.1 diguanylate cyclase [Halomonas beimenensis]